MELQARWNECEVYLHQGDITALEVDALVNAANSQLWAGGGVCGAIHRKGGPAIAEECSIIVATKGQVPTGGAVMTTGGNLPARHVIHAVGPVYDDYPKEQAAELLAMAYRCSLALARQHQLRSIAFPCISTGIYGYPPAQACQVALRTVREDLQKHNRLARLIFCTFTDEDHELFHQALKSR